MDVTLLPGQPVPSISGQGPAPKYGAGTFQRDDVVRASLVGILENKGGVRARSHVVRADVYDFHTKILSILLHYWHVFLGRFSLYLEFDQILRKKAVLYLGL